MSGHFLGAARWLPGPAPSAAWEMVRRCYPSCQLCPCHRTLVGGKPHKTGAASLQRADEVAASEQRCSARRGGRRLSSPRLLKFAGPSLPGPGVQPSRSHECKGYGRRGRVRRLCFQFSPGGRCSQQSVAISKVQRKGKAVSGAGGPADRAFASRLPFPLAGEPGPAGASSRRRWPLGSSPAPDWLTFQCHCGRPSPLRRRCRGRGRGGRAAPLRSAVHPCGPRPPPAPPDKPSSTCSPGPGVNPSHATEPGTEILILNSHRLLPLPPYLFLFFVSCFENMKTLKSCIPLLDLWVKMRQGEWKVAAARLVPAVQL